MSARGTFSKGQRVQLSDLGRERNIEKRRLHSRVGTVVGWSDDDRCVRVVWEGNSYSYVQSYRADFIAPLPDPPEPGGQP